MMDHPYREWWLDGERISAAELSRRTGRVLDNDPNAPTRQCLTHTAASSLFPDIAVEYMVRRAQEEISHGLGGPLRQEIAAADERDTVRLESLRDALMESCGFTPDGLGACQLTIQLFAQRAVRTLSTPLPAPLAAFLLVMGVSGWGRNWPQISAVMQEVRRLSFGWLNAPGEGTSESERIKTYLGELVEERADLASTDV